MDNAHEENYSRVLAFAYIENGIFPGVTFEEAQLFFEKTAEKDTAFGVTRHVVEDLLLSLWGQKCVFAEKVIRWDRRLHEDAVSKK